MTNNCLKSEKGVTLLTLTIYIIVLTAIVGIMAGVSSLFYNNIGMMKDAIENAGDFDTLNSCLISDSKSNSAVVVDETAKTIKFEDGTEITPELLKDMGLVKCIYRGEFKVASNVQYFSVTNSTKTVDNFQKNILSVKIIVGDSTQNLINQKIDYVLRYW